MALSSGMRIVSGNEIMHSDFFLLLFFLMEHRPLVYFRVFFPTTYHIPCRADLEGLLVSKYGSRVTTSWCQLGILGSVALVLLTWSASWPWGSFSSCASPGVGLLSRAAGLSRGHASAELVGLWEVARLMYAGQGR
jgi:hypothetical protein